MNDRFDVSDFGAKIAGLVPKDFDPTIRWSPSTPRTSRRWTCSSSTGWSPRSRGAGAVGLGGRHAGKAGRDRHHHRLRRRRLAGDGRGGRDHHREGPAPAVALHGAELPRQPRGGLDFDQLRLQGSDRRAGDRLRGIGPGHRRRHAADPDRRGGRRGVRRRRGLGRSDLDRRLWRGAGRSTPPSTTIPTEASRPFDTGTRRFRAGRGRGGGGDRAAEPRQGTRRDPAGDPCRLWHVGRRVSPHLRFARAAPGRRWRCARR